MPEITIDHHKGKIDQLKNFFKDLGSSGGRDQFLPVNKTGFDYIIFARRDFLSLLITI